MDSHWRLRRGMPDPARLVRSSNHRCRPVRQSASARCRGCPHTGGPVFFSDTPLEGNHVYRLDRGGNLATFSALESSSIYGCNVGNLIFFTTMIEPNAANPTQYVRLYGGLGDGPGGQY